MLLTPKGAVAGVVGIPGGVVFRLAWSPDGSRLALAVDEGLSVVAIDGGNMRLVFARADPTARGVGTDGLTWSRDASRIVFTYNNGIYSVNASGGRAAKLVDSRPAQGELPPASPAWRP